MASWAERGKSFVPAQKDKEIKEARLPTRIMKSVVALSFLSLFVASCNFRRPFESFNIQSPPAYAQDLPPKPILFEDTEKSNEVLREARLQRVPSEADRLEAIQNFETRQAGEYVLTKIAGDWSNDQLNILILGDKFANNSDFLPYAKASIDDIFLREPFKSNKIKFGVYVLSVENTPPLGCGNYSMCEGKTVSNVIDRVIDVFKLQMEETIVIGKFDSISGFAYADGEIERPTVYTFAYVTSGSIDWGVSVSAHEFGHSFGNLGDEAVSFRREPVPSVDIFINCLSKGALQRKWRDVPNQPGTSFFGCSNTSDGYRDAYLDIMNTVAVWPKQDFGPVDIYQLKKFIDQGLARYNLPRIIFRVFFPQINR